MTYDYLIYLPSARAADEFNFAHYGCRSIAYPIFAYPAIRANKVIVLPPPDKIMEHRSDDYVRWIREGPMCRVAPGGEFIQL